MNGFCHLPPFGGTERNGSRLYTYNYTYSAMPKKLTITIDEAVYDGLYRVVGPRRISQFIERLVRPHVLDLDAAYAAMAEDEDREAEALAWSEALMSDAAEDGDEAR